jgi:hypothetical protein
LKKVKVTKWNYKVCAGFENLEKELATGPLASSPRRPTAACPGPVLQYQPTNRARGLPRHRARHARPRRRATSLPTSTRAGLHARHGCCCHSELPRCHDLLRCAATCLLATALFLSSLASTAAPLLPPLLPPAALLLRHSEKLPPSSLRRPPPPRRAA